MQSIGETFEGNSLDRNKDTSDIKGEYYFLGDISGKEARLPISTDLLSKHVLILGGIGTGKTNTFFQLISQLQKNATPSDVFIIFDTKGDFYREFYRKGDIVLSNDEKATGPDETDYWNIFNEIALDERTEDAILEIAKTLFFDKIKHSQQPFFPMAAKDVFSGILTHFERKNKGLSPNNLELAEFCNVSAAADFRNTLSKYQDLRSIGSYISEDKSPQTQGVIAEMQQLVREIFIGNFRKKGDLSIRKLIRGKGGKTIFIEYDLGIGNLLTPIYRLLYDLAIKEALCRKKSEGNVYFIADEFRLIPNLQHIDDGVNFGRSLGAKFIVGVQNIDQINASYGEALAKSILSGFGTTMAFRVQDAATREYVKSIFGKNRKKDTYMSTIQSRGIVEQIYEANVVEDWDILNLDIGEAIVGFPGSPPFTFKFTKYEDCSF